MSHFERSLVAILAAAAFALPMPGAFVFAAEGAKLTVASAQPPQELAEPLRDALEAKSLQIVGDEGAFFDFWFRKELPLEKTPEGGALALDTIKEGTLLGAVKVHLKRYDFRDEEIPPGVYVMRYGIQPEDGNHLGVAPTRTFALLIDARTDKRLDPVPHEELVKQAATINAAKHPSNFNLQRLENADGQLPRLEERNDGQHKVLLLKLPARVAGEGEPTTISFALVYEGIGTF